MSRPWCLILLLLLFPGFASACQAYVEGYIDLVTYSFPDYKHESQFQYKDGYSQNDILYVKLLNLTVHNADTYCENSTARALIRLITPTGQEEVYDDFESIPLKNGTYVILGAKNSKYWYKDTVSGGVQLRTTGEYLLIPDVERTYKDTGRTTAFSSLFHLAGGELQEYPINVYDRTGKFKIAQGELFGYGCVSFVFVVLFIILSQGSIQAIKNFFGTLWKGVPGIYKSLVTLWKTLKDGFVFSALMMFSFAFTLLIISMFMAVTKQDELEADVFSFVSAAASMFIPIILAFIGWKFLELQEQNKDAANKKLFDKISARLKRVETELELEEKNGPQGKRGAPKPPKL